MRYSPKNNLLGSLLAFCMAFLPLELASQIPDDDIWGVGDEHAEGQLTIFNSEPEGGTIGLPLELGDFDGDGRTDFVSTAMFANTGPFDARTAGGEVYIYPGDGRLEGELDRAGRAGSAPGLTLIGGRTGDFLGTELFTADVNGDGIDDLLVGAQNLDQVAADGELVRDNCGGVFVVLGRRGLLDAGSTLDLLIPNDGVILLLGGEEGERAGVWVESGDLDGDGIDDILLGADQFPVAPRGADSRIRSGKVYVVYGRP
ncbi:MAG: VCBS repeat-containing protein, partial [Planctomycetota bacterium]